MLKVEQIKNTYYYKDFDPTLDNLNKVMKIIENYGDHGAQQLMYALQMNHIDIEEIDRLSIYIVDARERLEKELKRVKQFEKTFNQEFATDHNGYYNAVAELLRKMRSHLSVLKMVLSKTCPRKHPNKNVCHKYNIPSKSIYDKSMLAFTDYQEDAFGLPSYPDEVNGLHTELLKLFNAENECFAICHSIIMEEEAIKKDPQRAKYLLDKYRRKTYQHFKNIVMLITNEYIEELKTITPSYISYQKSSSEENFAANDFHEHNIADMEHFCLIELMEKDNEFTNEEYALFGKSPETIRKVKKAIACFDNCLPDDFKTSKLGEYQYMFCKWAMPNNIKGMNEYLMKHYTGKYQLRKYGGVNKHSSKYDKNSPEVTDFHSRIDAHCNPQSQISTIEITIQ